MKNIKYMLIIIFLFISGCSQNGQSVEKLHQNIQESRDGSLWVVPMKEYEDYLNSINSDSAADDIILLSAIEHSIPKPNRWELYTLKYGYKFKDIASYYYQEMKNSGYEVFYFEVDDDNDSGLIGFYSEIQLVYVEGLGGKSPENKSMVTVYYINRPTDFIPPNNNFGSE